MRKMSISTQKVNFGDFQRKSESQPWLSYLWNKILYEDFGNRSESRQFVGEPPHMAAQPPHAVAKHNSNLHFIFPCLCLYLFLYLCLYFIFIFIFFWFYIYIYFNNCLFTYSFLFGFVLDFCSSTEPPLAASFTNISQPPLQSIFHSTTGHLPSPFHLLSPPPLATSYSPFHQPISTTETTSLSSPIYSHTTKLIHNNHHHRTCKAINTIHNSSHRRSKSRRLQYSAPAKLTHHVQV